MKTKIEELEKRIKEIQNELSLIKAQPTVQKYPKSEWIELWGKIDDQFFYAKLFSRDYFLFAALVETCKEWNRIDGFNPDWEDNYAKFTVGVYENKVRILDTWGISRPIIFKDELTAKLFLDTYRSELEQVKHLL